MLQSARLFRHHLRRIIRVHAWRRGLLPFSAARRISWRWIACLLCQPSRAAVSVAGEKPGYTEGRNVAINFAGRKVSTEIVWLAADLVGRQVAVIVAPGALLRRSRQNRRPQRSQLSSRWVPTQSPIGLVGSLSRPGGNLTGVSSLNVRSNAEAAGNFCTRWFPRRP